MTGEADTNNKSVLVVDDDENLNELVCLALKDAGFESMSAYDGRSALKIARNILPDIILLDIMLPDIDGRRICEDLTENASTMSIPVIIMSSMDDISSKISAFIGGAKRYVTKTFDMSEIIAEVRRALEQRRLSEMACCSREDHG